MQENQEGAVGSPKFFAFLHNRGREVIIILLLALAVRVGFVVVNPGHAGDQKYQSTAINILEGHGFSLDERPPYRASEASAPAYPLFIAGVYALFGRGETPLALSQAFLDLLTCLLVAFAAFSLAPPHLKERAVLSSLVVYGIFSWPTMVWIPFPLAETLTLFFIMVTVAFCAQALPGERLRYWGGAGLACGLAILTRPDSVLLAGAVLLFLLAHWVKTPGRSRALPAVVFCLSVVFSLTPWVVRNYVSLGKFQPLASEYAHVRDEYFPRGYLWWVRTWLKDETHFQFAFDPPWFPEITLVDPAQLPRDAYDSEDERQLLVGLFNRYNEARLITPELDREFRNLGNERVRRDPLRCLLLIPLHRAASLWLTGFSTSHRTPYVLILRVLSVLPIHIGGALGLALLCRRRPLASLLALIVLVRTAFLAYHYAPETRYMAGVYPPMIAACGVTAAAAWSYVSGGRLKFAALKRRKLAGERA